MAPGPEPEDHINSTISLILPVVLDNSPLGSRFGDVLEEPPLEVRRGESVSAVFVSIYLYQLKVAVSPGGHTD